MRTAKIRSFHAALLVVFFLIPISDSLANSTALTCLTPDEKTLLEEHVFGGLPSRDNIYVRTGYILSFNPKAKTPNWVAYHIKPDYLNTPKRQGRFKTFRDDPNIDGEASDADYKNLFTIRGYARGHLAPYAVMGGDRDGDGKYAAADEDDALTVFQSNYMTNIAPQHHRGFNGPPGLWWKLERWIQDELVAEQGKEVWVFAGCLFGPGQHERVGPHNNISVPPMFYKIVITQTSDPDFPTVLAFLFPHQRSAHGDIQDFLATVDIIEALAGLDFFNTLDDQKEILLEDQDTWQIWKKHFCSGPQ
jgi:endonuclease G